MTHLITSRILTLHRTAKPALALATLLSAALMSTSPAVAQTIAGNDQKLEGAWSIDVLGDPGSITVKTSGFFTRDGSLFIQNAVPNIVPGALILHGTGEWVRSGNRQFDLTWIYPIVSSVDGSYIGEFRDLARIHYNADGTLEGISTFKFILANGTLQFAGSSKLKMVRVRVEPMP